MRLANLLLSIGLLVSSLPSVAADGTTLSLPRAGNWVMSYNEDSCNLFAKFGAGKQAIGLNIARIEPGELFDLSLYGERFASVKSGGQLQVGFIPGSHTVKRDILAGTLAKDMPMIMARSLRLDGWENVNGEEMPAGSPEQEAQISSIDVRFQGKSFRLETGSMGKPMKSMRECTADLVHHWGYDPEVQAKLRQPARPAGKPDDVWIGSKDYPYDAIRNRHSGLVQYRLDVNEEGKVTGCRVLFRTNPDDFANLTCKLLLQRAKFTAALGSEGKPVKSYFVGRVNWSAR